MGESLKVGNDSDSNPGGFRREAKAPVERWQAKSRRSWASGSKHASEKQRNVSEAGGESLKVHKQKQPHKADSHKDDQRIGRSGIIKMPQCRAAAF